MHILVLADAMQADARGKSIAVTSAGSDVQEVLHEYECLLVGVALDMARAATMLLLDETLRRQSAQAVRELAPLYEWEKIRTELCRIIESGS